MSEAKAVLIDRINSFSDEIVDEMQLVEKLYVLTRLEHSKKRCEEEGTISTGELREYFKNKRREYEGI